MGKYKVEICGVNTATLPVVKSQQMTELFIQLQDGDLSAKEKLINGNLSLFCRLFSALRTARKTWTICFRSAASD